MPKQALTAQDIAALASGAANAEARTAEQIAADEAAATQAAVDAAAAAAATSAAATAAVTQPKEESQAVLAYVQGQLATAQVDLAKATVELTGLKATVATMQASHAALVKIAAASASNMRIALRLAPVDMSAMSAETVLAEHTATSAAFAKAFPVGGVAATTTAAEKKADVDPHHKARLAATRI